MVKGSILGTSIATLAFFLLWRMADMLNLNGLGAGILAGIMIIGWILLLVMVFKDVKNNGNSTLWIALTLLTGWVGGTIYAIAAKDNEVTEARAEQERTGNLKNAAIFNYIIAGILFVAALATLAGASYVTIILFALAIGFFFLGRYLWKK